MFKVGVAESEGGFKMCVFACASSVRPPLEKGGQGGLRGKAGTFGRCDNSAKWTAVPELCLRLRLRGDTPPFSRGDAAQRNPDEDKDCTRRTLRGDTPPAPPSQGGDDLAPPSQGGDERDGIRMKTRLVQDELFITRA